MALYAYKNGVTIVNEDNWNQPLVSQPFKLIYAGSQRDAKAGAGVTENSIATYNYAARFTLIGATDIGRVEMELDRDGDGADLTVQIRSGLTSGNDGTLIKEVVLPKEFISLTAGWVSIPFNLTGLTAGAYYWIVVIRAGDAANKIDWVGESSTDSSYPVYRRSGSTGTWTTGRPAMHFKVFSNDPAEDQDDVIHRITSDTAYATYEYDGDGLIEKIYRYIPPEDGPAGGIRSILTMQMSGEYIMGGE